MKLKRMFAFVIAILAVQGTAIHAEGQDWELLGERQVNRQADHDVIRVGARDGRFRTIQLRVRDNAVHLMDLRVNFANGTTYDVPVRSLLRAGASTRAIDLPGDLRVIRNVRMTYQTAGRRARGRASVRLFGRRAPSQIGLGGSGVGGGGTGQSAANAEFLGERAVNFRADHDVIPVGIQDGRFRSLQLRVRDSAIHLLDLRVNFANGSTFDVPVRANIAAGSQTRWIDLPGDLRVIRNVRMTYQTAGRPGRGRATVRLFGRRGAVASTARPAVQVQVAPATRPTVQVQVAPATRPTVQVAPAGNPNAEFLGERAVNFRADHDVIPVGARDGRFRRIQLRVRGTAIHMMDLRVNFANGTTFDAPVRANIAAGSQTRWIDLPGNLRVIRNVRLTYRSRSVRPNRPGRATVRLFGSRN